MSSPRPGQRGARPLVGVAAELFVYGSLSFPPVLEVLLGRVPKQEQAQLSGWRAAALRDRVFPGLTPASRQVGGLLLQALTPAERGMIDAFEGRFYDLVTVHLDDGRAAVTYTCADASLVCETDWDRESFGRRHLDAYVSMCTRWRTGFVTDSEDVDADADAGEQRIGQRGGRRGV